MKPNLTLYMKSGQYIMCVQFTLPGRKGTDVARNKEAVQSTIHAGAVATRALDGDNGRYTYMSTCTHTSQVNTATPWWRVDLGKRYLVYGLIIFNRYDCCSKSLFHIVPSP